MRFLPVAGLAALALCLVTAPAPAEPPEEPLAKQVNNAIEHGIRFLRTEGEKGNWEVSVEATLAYPAGVSALAMLALLTAGVPPDDPLIQKGLKYLRTIEPTKTYVVSLQTMVLIQAGMEIDKKQIRDNVAWLVETRTPNGWRYGKDNIGADASNTQYALLALHEAKQAGYEVDSDALQAVQKYYLDTQHVKDADGGKTDYGSWNYRTMPSSVSMTTAGLCGLYITGTDLHNGLAVLQDDGSAKNCGQYKENPNVAAAIKYLSMKIPAPLTNNSLNPTYYTLYGIERAGRYSGERFLGEHDWYRLGCEFLVKEQNRSNGSWRGDNRVGENAPVVATSFALLFLSKGRTPVLVTKLAFGQPNYQGWNNKHNDARNLTEFASKNLFKRQPMAWQVFDVRSRSADSKEARRDLAAELLQSPLVYFNGHDEVPSGKEEEILQEYVENGGFIFAEACCGREEFKKNFEALMKRMFPDSQLRKLPPEHPVWNAAGKLAVVAGKPFDLYGIEHGCKTVVIFSPKPITGYWEENQFDKGNGEIAFKLGANIIAYATGLEPPKQKGVEAPIFRDDSQKADITRGYLKVAQLFPQEEKVPPAANAMRNLMSESRKLGLDVMLKTEPVDPTSESDVVSYNFFYMHGKKGFTSAKEDLKPLRFKLEDNGTLLADACCGSRAFDEAFHKFIDELFNHEAKLVDIPLNDPLFSKQINGEAIETVQCRREPGTKFATVAPALQGVKVGKRWAVIYSKYDLGCALEHGNSPDCLGHDFASAVKLGRAAVLYHLYRGATPSEGSKPIR
jgi:hypothetical protein